MTKEEENCLIGGSLFFSIIGKFLGSLSKKLQDKSELYIERGKVRKICNPSSKFINPFTILVQFSIDYKENYQLILQGDYRNKYKELGTDENPISEQEMVMLTKQNKHLWFSKNI